jgi:Ser/Thr protein kinase RdoA (MazF antagonist)
MTPAETTLIARIMRLYGIQYARLGVPQKGYRNTCYPVHCKNGETRLFILFKHEPDILRTITRANAVGDFLAAHALPARQTKSTRIIALRSPQRVRYGALYNYLPGRTIPWENYTRHHIKLLGEAMSNMHAALTGMLTSGFPAVTTQYSTITKRMQHYFTQATVCEAIAVKLNLVVVPHALLRASTTARYCHNLPHQQALHMDFVRGNILFGQTSKKLAISGILDFEKTALGHPLCDIARTLAFLFVDCAALPEADIRRYFLYSGYTKRGAANFRNIRIRTSTGTINMLEALIDLFLLYDFYKFLRHNPYEYLAENHHFERTKSLLLQRGLLRVVGK